MIKYFALLLFVGISFAGISQKVKIKDDVASVDGTDYLIVTKRVLGNELSIKGMDAEMEEISCMYLDYKDENEKSESNKSGTVDWIELNFIDLGLRCEVPAVFPKGMVKMLYENKIYVDGQLNEENVNRLVKKYGMRYSENRPGGNVNIIINTN